MAYEFRIPKQVFLGEGALESAKEAVQALGTKAFIVTGPHVAASGLVKNLADTLKEWGIASCVFSDITGEPTLDMIEFGVESYKNQNCDFLIGIGGGSPLDSVKAIGAMSVLEGTLADYMGKEITGDFPPMVLIPTTAGTGSETTKFTIITDTEKDIKMLLKGGKLLPDVAIIDAQFTYGMPKSVTAATGMDALTHAIESYTSKKGNSFTDMFALSAIRRIFTYLPKAYKDGENKKAREEMSIAAFEAGVCINNASVTLVHGMSRPIGALFHVPHGISNAMILGECLEFAMDGCISRFADMARSVQVADCMDSDKQAAKAFLAALKSLMTEIEIPTLQGYGVDKEEFTSCIPKMAEDAMASGSPGNTIKEVTKTDCISIYGRLISIT